MVKSFSTPANSPTVNFSTNTNSPVVAFDSGTQDPGLGITGPITFGSDGIIRYGGQIVVH